MRRQSIDPDDLRASPMSAAIDLCARGLLIAEKMIEDGKLAGSRSTTRYAGWDGREARTSSPAAPRSTTWRDYVLKRRSSRSRRAASQEWLEQLVNEYL